MFIQSWLIQTTGMRGAWYPWWRLRARLHKYRFPAAEAGMADVFGAKWFHLIFADTVHLLGTVCSGKMGENKAAKWKARHSVTYSTRSPWTMRLNSTNGLPSVRLERYYSLINGRATHYRKCPIAWDSKWFLYASWLRRAGMKKCWWLLPVKHEASILQDERKGNCGIAGMFLLRPQIPNSRQFLSKWWKRTAFDPAEKEDAVKVASF